MNKTKKLIYHKKTSSFAKSLKNKHNVIPEEFKDITATIDAAAIRHNVDYLRKKAGTEVMPVLKANAYGHGITGVSMILRNHGIKKIGLATLGEALLLRKNGDKGILVAWLYDIYNEPQLKKAIQQNIDICIIDDNHVSIIRNLIPKNKKCRVHLFADTGIDRAAVPYSKCIHVAKMLHSDPKFDLVGLMSHLIISEYKNEPTVLKQLKLFRNLRRELEENHNIFIENIHIANTGGCLNYDVSDFTLARPGSGIYGIDPSGKYNKNLQPALQMTSKIIQLKYISKGADVGYDNKYIAPKNMRVGIIPFGYADFIPRSSFGRLYVYVKGNRRKVIGSINMDQIVIEAGEKDQLGDEIVVYGNPLKGAKQTVYDIAEINNTIPHEILVRNNYRVALNYINV